MNRLTRITAILIQLQSKRIVTAKEIAERFEISLRTVYRDIKTLQDAGVPIGSENGVGYFIVDGYRLPPISLTEEEANALIIVEELIKKQGDKSIDKNLNSIIIKVKATLKSFQKDDIELLSSRTFSLHNQNYTESSWLSEIQKSILRKQILKINYRSISKEQTTSREIEPLSVYFTSQSWVVIAFCHLRNDLREFRLDRIIKLTNTQTPFSIDIPFSLENYFEKIQS